MTGELERAVHAVVLENRQSRLEEGKAEQTTEERLEKEREELAKRSHFRSNVA